MAGRSLRQPWSGRSLRRVFREVRHGHVYAPLEIRRIPTDELRVRLEPNLIPASPGLRPGRTGDARDGEQMLMVENPIERFLPITDGYRDRRMLHTPHVALLLDHRAGREIPPDHDYIRLLRVRGEIRGKPPSKKYLDSKVACLISIYESVRLYGYRSRRYRHRPIVVFETPLPPPSGTYRPLNWEIVDGHHRAAAVVAFEMEEVEVLLVRATRVEPYDWSVHVGCEDVWGAVESAG